MITTRRAALPDIAYPDLPVSERRGEIADAIRDHQVVVVAGETGSGKTTQLPKICLELGRGIRGTIGHTQPRRLAARTVAQRIADELHTPLGDAVGYTVRFTDQVSDRTLVKLMTDGILLAEIQRDRLLLPLRHADPRRGARAQPQHRLPARLPHRTVAAASRPEARSSRPRPSTRNGSRALRRRPDRRGQSAVPIRSRSATGRSSHPRR